MEARGFGQGGTSAQARVGGAPERGSDLRQVGRPVGGGGTPGSPRTRNRKRHRGGAGSGVGLPHGGRAARFAFLAQVRGSVEDVEASSPARRFVFSRESKGIACPPSPATT